MGEIAGALIMDLSALGHTLKPLIRDGYVETVADKDDHRIRRIRLTTAGEKKLTRRRKLRQVAQHGLEDHIGADKAEKLRIALDEIAGLELGNGSAA
jgi:DNA-binding MarR family transcriptional regulator